MINIKNSILVTGAAGFIGSALVKRLLKKNFNVIGIDNINNYYDTNLKKDRLKDINKTIILNKNNWKFIKCDLVDSNSLEKIYSDFSPDVVVNLAAQAGVRNSIHNPNDYIQSNLVGFNNVLEASKKFKIKNLVYASSSSVYGGNINTPFSEDQSVNHPINLYAATKISNELMAHSFSHLCGIPSIGLRFFTVYGPWGRPDMAPMLFTKAIFEGKPIKVFNNGDMERDFTFIDDIVEGIIGCCLKPAEGEINFDNQHPNISTSFAPHRVFNIGNCKPVNLLKFIETLENIIGIKSKKEFEPMQQGDMISTYADVKKITSWIGFKPKIDLEVGLNFFVKWYRNYYGI